MTDFIHFENTHLDTSWIELWILENLKGFTGIINVECIGDSILEVHLRMSSEFVDLYGPEWMESVIYLYESGSWIDPGVPLSAYSFVLRIPKKGNERLTIKQPDLQEIRGLENLGVKIRITCEFDEPLETEEYENDTRTYRLALVNGDDRSTCEKVLAAMKKMLLGG